MLRRVVVVVRESDAEEARARLLELVPAGFEERDAAGTVELAAYVDGDDTEAALRAAFVDVSSSVVEPGWEDAWRSFHRPVSAGGIWIGPPWEPRAGRHAERGDRPGPRVRHGRPPDDPPLHRAARRARARLPARRRLRLGCPLDRRRAARVRAADRGRRRRRGGGHRAGECVGQRRPSRGQGRGRGGGVAPACCRGRRKRLARRPVETVLRRLAAADVVDVRLPGRRAPGGVRLGARREPASSTAGRPTTFGVGARAANTNRCGDSTV